MVGTQDQIWGHFETVRDERRRVVECSCKHCDYSTRWPKLETVRLHLSDCVPEAGAAGTSDGSSAFGQESEGNDGDLSTSGFMAECEVDIKEEPDQYTADMEINEGDYSYDPDQHSDSDTDAPNKRTGAGTSAGNKHFKSENHSKCLFCRKNVGSAGLKNLTGSAMSYKTTGAAVCDVLKLDKSFLLYIKEAVYCKSCLELIESVKINLRTLREVEKTLASYRRKIETLLTRNLKTISPSATLEDPLQPFSRSTGLSYEETVKCICQFLSVTEGNDTGNETRTEVVFDVSNVRDQPENHLSDGLLRPARSIRLRMKPKISFKEEQRQSDEEQGHNDPDFDASSLHEPENDAKKDESEDTVSEYEEEQEDTDDSDYQPSKSSKLRQKKSSKLLQKKSSELIQKKYLKMLQKKRSKTVTQTRIGRLITPLPVPVRTKVRETVYTTKNKLKCTVENCDYTCTKPNWLQFHVREVHEGNPRPFFCDLCPETFTNHTSYCYHYVRHTKEPTIDCPYCSKLFYERWQLTKHVHSVHMSEKKKMRCNFCSFVLESCEESDLKAHMALHKERSESKPYSCVFCENQDFKNKSDLKQHVGFTHQPDLKTVKCTKCEKKFSSAGLLKLHVDGLYCESNPNLKCKICPDYVAKNRTELLRHKVTHQERQFMCDQCGFAFKNSTALRIHTRIHTGEKPYKCKTCGKCFRVGHLLKSHEEIHLTEKNYVCEGCGKRFRASKNLHQHKNGHCNSIDGSNPKRKRTLSKERPRNAPAQESSESLVHVALEPGPEVHRGHHASHAMNMTMFHPQQGAAASIHYPVFPGSSVISYNHMFPFQ